MWILCNDKMLSVVQDRNNNQRYVVRSRFRGDLEKSFPKYSVIESLKSDYQFRAFVPKSAVIALIMEELQDIDYDNFKNSVPYEEDERYHAYSDVWGVLLGYQENNPFIRNYISHENFSTISKRIVQ